MEDNTNEEWPGNWPLPIQGQMKVGVPPSSVLVLAKANSLPQSHLHLSLYWQRPIPCHSPTFICPCIGKGQFPATVPPSSVLVLAKANSLPQSHLHLSLYWQRPIPCHSPTFICPCIGKCQFPATVPPSSVLVLAKANSLPQSHRHLSLYWQRLIPCHSPTFICPCIGKDQFPGHSSSVLSSNLYRNCCNICGSLPNLARLQCRQDHLYLIWDKMLCLRSCAINVCVCVYPSCQLVYSGQTKYGSILTQNMFSHF